MIPRARPAVDRTLRVAWQIRANLGGIFRWLGLFLGVCGGLQAEATEGVAEKPAHTGSGRCDAIDAASGHWYEETGLEIAPCAWLVSNC